MMRAILSLIAAFVVCLGSATAQTLTAEMFARDPNMWSASLSPDGRSVVMIQRLQHGEAVVVVDWRTRQAQAVQTARRDRGLFLDWVIWKGDNRLLFAVTQRVNWDGTPQDTTYQRIQRVYGMNRDGTNITQMFEGQMRRLLNPDFAPIDLVDALESDSENVLLGTWGQDGYTLYRVNVNTGRSNIVEDDMGWDTVEVFVDGAGNPILRTDALPYYSGYRYYRRAPEGGRWQLAYEMRRASVAQNRDFYPISAGPGAGQIYIAARPEGQEYQAIYLYDTRTGELGAPTYAHPNADANGIRVDPSDNSLLAGCGEAQRWECRASDPRMQRHFDAISTYFEGTADFSIINVSHAKDIWLIEANGPTIPPTAHRLRLRSCRRTAHADRVIISAAAARAAGADTSGSLRGARRNAALGLPHDSPRRVRPAAACRRAPRRTRVARLLRLRLF
jgi:hypothetical protein